MIRTETCSRLTTNRSLTELNVARNNLTDNGQRMEGLTTFCKALRANKGLTKLTFSGDWSLSKAVAVDTASIAEGFFKHEYLGQTGGEILAVLLPKCTSLKSVDIVEDRIPKPTLDKLRYAAIDCEAEFKYAAGTELFSATYAELGHM